MNYNFINFNFINFNINLYLTSSLSKNYTIKNY